MAEENSTGEKGEELHTRMRAPRTETYEMSIEPTDWEQMNKYELAEELVTKDANLGGPIDMLSSQIQACYHGPFVKPGEELSEKEEALLHWAKKFANKHRLHERFETIAEHLLKFGDVIYEVQRNPDDTLNKLRLLPIYSMTIVENEDQIGNTGIQVFERGKYVLNEGYMDVKSGLEEFDREIWDSSNILHFSLDPEGSKVEDLQGRTTFSVWSHSPVESLKLLALWRRTSIEDDIRWKHANVPRELHRIDVSHIDPEMFEGDSLEERMKAAQSAVEEEIKTYKDGISPKEPDKGYVTTKDVDVEYLESSTSYKEPNDLIDQIEYMYCGRLGIPSSAIGAGVFRQYRGAMITKAYSTMKAKQTAKKIAEKFENLMREEAKKAPELQKYDLTEEDLWKLNIRIKLVLDIDRYELARQVSILAETDCFTRNELREMMGYEPLRGDRGEEMPEGNPLRKRSPDQMQEYAKRSPMREPNTPESREDTLEPR